jgi:CBS domain-containing protein
MEAMARVYDLVKNTRVLTTDAEKYVVEAARTMMERNIGALPVLRDGKLVGIVSERDIMNRVVASGRNAGSTRVSEIMTANPRTVGPDEPVEDCLFLMRELGFRHLPICENGEVKGLVSLRDLLMNYAAELERRRIA